MNRTYYGHPRLDYQEPMSKLGLYQEIAKRHGTVIESTSPGVVPRIGGGNTKHPLATDVAELLARALREVGAEAKVCPADDEGRRFVYLSGCSFVKGDRL